MARTAQPGASPTEIQNSTYTYAADAQVSDTYAITLVSAPAGYVTGQQFRFKANTANTGAASLNVNGLGPITIKKLHDQDLVTGDIESGQIVTVVYDATGPVFQMESQVASSTDLSGYAPLASPTFTGTVTLPIVQLGEASIKLDAALSADGTWSGITETGTAGAALAFGDLCYFQAADSRWELADANLSAGYDKKLGMCVLAAAGDGSATEMLLIGKIRADANFPTLTIGSPVYMAETAGDIVVAQPTTADVCIRVIGYANTADELWFNPSNDYIIHT